jgi:hypothetical protein
MIIFIYDESASVQEHGQTRAALTRLPDVIIHLPAKPRTRPSTANENHPGEMLETSGAGAATWLIAPRP